MAIRISRPDFVTSLSDVDQIILTVTMSPEYPQVAPGISISGDALHRRAAAQLSTAIAAEAEQLVGQPMMLDKFYTLLSLKGKGKDRTLVIAPQVDTATTEVLRYVARTKQHRTYLPYTFAFIASTHLPTPRGQRVEQAHAQGAKSNGCYVTAHSQQEWNPRPCGC